jgi:hypothetical protein
VESTLIFEFDDAAGVIFSVLLYFIVGEEHFAHTSLAELLSKNKLSSWIFLNKMNTFNHCLKLTRG